MPRINLSVQEALAIFEELSSDDDSAASNNSDIDDEDYVENVALRENISSDDEKKLKKYSVLLLPSQNSPRVDCHASLHNRSSM
ncbi:hypothetical protein TNIN_169191 [Trichonephila inaurata madagascariensis]|uniref:Uncharacterized protein n=1 Tax=Trichonephila inaurata madagascariensis TaxID=2747483 RepID=A0A8X6Y2Z3_9ARAC|nr:hypothetical protein TNIN_169191 [Trichonephila inaurata madagascariensis]